MKARLTVRLPGADNDLSVVAVADGVPGTAVSFAIAAAAVQAETGVAADGSAVTVTPGTKARMIVTGTLTDGTDPVVFPPLLYAGGTGGSEIWSDTGTYPDCEYHLDNVGLYFNHGGNGWYFGSSERWPDLVSSWTPQGSETGTPVVTAGVSSAAQGIAAMAASPGCAALVSSSPAPGNSGAGTLSEFPATNLKLPKTMDLSQSAKLTVETSASAASERPGISNVPLGNKWALSFPDADTFHTIRATAATLATGEASFRLSLDALTAATTAGTLDFVKTGGLDFEGIEFPPMTRVQAIVISTKRLSGANAHPVVFDNSGDGGAEGSSVHSNSLRVLTFEHAAEGAVLGTEGGLAASLDFTLSAVGDQVEVTVIGNTL